LTDVPRRDTGNSHKVSDLPRVECDSHTRDSEVYGNRL